MPDAWVRPDLRPLPEVPRVNILGVGVCACNLHQAVSAMCRAAARRQAQYVCVTGVHGVMEAQKDARFMEIQNRSALTVPDGMPLVWVGKLRGHETIERVYGPDLMLAVCRLSQFSGHTHFLFGGKPGVAQQLRAVLEKRFPGLAVVGAYTPPFRPMNAAEQAELIAAVNRSQPDFLWVGLSTPKQERFMAEYAGRLRAGLMIGVGAAFDIHTGNLKDSPGFLKQAGLQWLHRLFQEPRRLWKRYLVNNPKFLLEIALQLLGARNYSPPTQT